MLVCSDGGKGRVERVRRGDGEEVREDSGGSIDELIAWAPGLELVGRVGDVGEVVGKRCERFQGYTW